MGGTKTAFDFVDIKGKLIRATTIPTQSRDSAKTLVSRLHKRIEKVRADLPSSHRLCGIGVGARMLIAIGEPSKKLPILTGGRPLALLD
jgi:predicted NBD/HSP70 family sugar kinase